jgi:unsaturated rhamnogalacturonyl hydrolase
MTVSGNQKSRIKNRKFMKTSLLFRTAVALAAALLVSLPLSAEGPFRNRDNPDLHDEAEGTYPIPYHLPKPEEIKAVLDRIHANLDRAMETKVIHA